MTGLSRRSDRDVSLPASSIQRLDIDVRCRAHAVGCKQTNDFASPFAHHSSSKAFGVPPPTRDLHRGKQQAVFARRHKEAPSILAKHNGAISLTIGLLC